MHISKIALAAFAMAGVVSAVAGQAEAQVGQIAVSGDLPSEWELRDRGQLPAAEDRDLLRRVAPQGDVREWVAEGDLIQLQTDGGLTKTAHAELLLEIDADGRIEKCKVKEATSGSGAEALCERLASRVRMIPALDRTGARAADFYDLDVWFGGDVGEPPPPRLRVRQPVVIDWPYNAISLTVVRGGFDQLAAHPFSAGAYNGPIARVVVAPNDRGEINCTLAPYYAPDAALDAQACAAALQGQFDFTGENKGNSAYLFFFQHEGRLAVLLPVYSLAQTGGPISESMAEVRAALTPDATSRVRVNFSVDVNGEISRCTIHTSSGNDVQDFTVCDRLQRLGRFERSLDAFGRAVPRTMIEWGLPVG